MYYIGDGDAIRTEKRGNPDYVLGDVVYLLRIEADDNAYYIYIKLLERLFHSYTCSATVGKKICPLCEKKVDEKEYRAHLTQCQKYGTEGTLTILPPEGSTMQFTNFKNKLERPFIVYADMESTLIKTDHENNIHDHVPNSCSFYFVCTYDSTQNKYWQDVSINCVENMIKELNRLAYNCINKMK